MNQIATEAVARWTDPKRRPLFRGSLIDPDGCKCAQGDVLAACGWTDKQLRALAQEQADTETMKLLGISRAHTILLRAVNDKTDGCPQDVLSAPEKVLGKHARLLLAFWRHLDAMTPEMWDAAWDAVRAAAAYASNEIQGHENLDKLFFLPMFGLTIERLKMSVATE